MLSETQTQADPSQPAAPQIIVVPNRPLLEGVVTDHAGEVLTGGQVHARRRTDAAPEDILSIAPPPFVAQIDTFGTYAMHLDAGVYDLSVLPTAESGAPPMLVNGHDITENQTLDFDLPAPGLAHMTVTSPEGAPLSDVTIELYRADDETDPPRVLVKGTTDLDGVVDLLVPHPP